MKSKGGKREWLCPNCNSPEIRRGKMLHDLNVGICETCNSWWYPWSRKISISVGQPLPAIKKIRIGMKTKTRKYLIVLMLTALALIMFVGPLTMMMIQSTDSKPDTVILKRR